MCRSDFNDLAKIMTMPSPAYIAFDVETRPLPDLVERYARPYPEFDVDAVKYGNTKDPAKRADLLASKRTEHEADRVAYWKNLHERAALDPFTGAIICIGIISDTGEPEIFAEKTEDATLRQFWNLVAMSDHALTKFVMWSGCGDASKMFDLDYIVTRSRINRIPLPARVRDGRFYNHRFVDLAKEFLLYQRERFLSLTKAADMLGLYAEHKDILPKSDEDIVRAENFWQWWDGSAEAGVGMHSDQQRDLARQYLCNDLRLTRYLAQIIVA